MKLFKKYIGILFVASALYSCEKQLVDLSPIDQIPAENAINTIADAERAVNGVYGTYAGRRAVYLSSFISDELRLGTGSEYRNVGNILFNWNHVSDSQDWRDGENGGAWTNLYQVIDRANRVLELLAPIAALNATEQATKDRLRGEMLGMRAFAHLELLRWFSATPGYSATALGVVVQSEFVKAPGTYLPTRVAQAVAVALITTDLAEARTLIPISFNRISRLTRNAIIAGQARLALHTSNWPDVVTFAGEVIAAQPISAPSIYADIWLQRSLTENQSTEVIWRLNVTAANLGAAIGSLWQDVGSGNLQAAPSAKLLSQFDSADNRAAIFFRTSPRNLIQKYGVVLTGNAENFQYDIKMIRTSEILLARAEAYAEQENFVASNGDLSALRTARITGYVHTPINNKADLITAIINERFKELCFEGHRYFDLRRRSLPILRNADDVVGNTAIQNLLPSNFRYILPIPFAEQAANPNIQQNASY